MRSFIYISLVIILTFCSDKVDFIDQPFPRVITNEVTHITEAGARFNGNAETHKGKIIDHGFLWDGVPPTIGSSEQISLGALQNDQFSSDISSTLRDESNYYVRAYIKTDQYLVYGSVVEFTSRGSSGPVIEDFQPKEGHIGDVISITGAGFSNLPYNNMVQFAFWQANILSFSDSLITVSVPDINYELSKISVSVAGKTTTSTDDFKLIP